MPIHPGSSKKADYNLLNMDNSFEFLSKLEDFFSSPQFTSSVGSFLAEYTRQLEYKSLEEEQPLK